MADQSPQSVVSSRLRRSAALLGPVFYWAWCLLAITRVHNRLDVGGGELAGLVAITAVILAATIGSRRMVGRERRLLSYLLISIPFATLSPIALALLEENPGSSVLGVAAGVFGAIGFGGAMLLWGLWFAAMEPRKVHEAVGGSALLSVGVFLVIAAMPPLLGVVMNAVLPILSGVAFALAPHPPAGQPPTPASQSHRGFVAERVAFGFSMGLAQCFATLGGTGAFDGDAARVAALALGLLVLGGVLLLTGRFAFGARHLPALPLLAAGFLLLPFLGSGTPVFLQIARASGWLCWMIMSSVELSSDKIRFGLTPASIAFSDKLLVMGGMLVGFVFGEGVVRWTGIQAGPFATGLVVVFAYLVVLASTLSLLSYATKNQVALGASAHDVSFDAQLLAACRQVAAEHQLTAREEEVLILLAAGRNRPYIESALRISTGTANTHIRHIYDKVGVHERNELLDLVQQIMRGPLVT